MKPHKFINSNPAGFDSNCTTCGGKHRDAIHRIEQMTTEDAQISTDRGIAATQFDDAGAGRATYNIADDRFKFYPVERLNADDYAEAKACKFQWFPGQKCFSAIWRPQAEDFLARLGVTVEDVCEVDDVAARVERFDGYAAKAEETASNAAERLENGQANTERRQRLAENVAAREFSTAAHWQRRIAGAIRHAQHKENPGAILRRIKTLETDLRRHERADNARWIVHLTHRIEYETARLAATGHTLAKLASNEIVLEKGGALHCNRRRFKVEGWYLITRINPASVEVYAPQNEEWRGAYTKIPRDEIGEIATAAQVAAGSPTVAHPEAPKVSNQPKGTAQTRDGKTPEKFGAFGRSNGFGCKLEDVDRWYLITKVNRLTVEFISPEPGTGKLYGGKTEIHGLRHVLTPAEVKAQRPELLDAWQKVEEIRARQAAKKTEQPAA